MSASDVFSKLLPYSIWVIVTSSLLRLPFSWQKWTQRKAQVGPNAPLEIRHRTAYAIVHSVHACVQLAAALLIGILMQSDDQDQFAPALGLLLTMVMAGQVSDLQAGRDMM